MTSADIDPSFRLSAESGRSVQSLSVDKSSGKWLFSECSEKVQPSGCFIVTYAPVEKRLIRYGLSGAYLYSYPRFTDDGRRIVANRQPRHDGTPEGRAESARRSAIILFDEGGGKAPEVIAEGPKLGPVISPGGHHLAYWKTTVETGLSHGKTGYPFDLYLLDLRTGVEVPFSGINRFYAGGLIYFASDDLIYSMATGPTVENYQEYSRKINGSEVFLFKRGADSFVPLFTEFRNARNVSLDARGGTVFYGTRSKEGSSFIRIDRDGSDRFVVVPHVQFMAEVAAEPNGRTAVFIYGAMDSKPAERKLGFGRVDFAERTSLPVMLPPLPEAEVIDVQ